MFVPLQDVADFWSKTSECYHFTTFFQDDVIGQRQPQPPAKYGRQLSSVAQPTVKEGAQRTSTQDTTAGSVATSTKPSDKVRPTGS